MIIDMALATSAQANQAHNGGTPPQAIATASPASPARTNTQAARTAIGRTPKREIRRLFTSSAAAMPTPESPNSSVNCELRP